MIIKSLSLIAVMIGCDRTAQDSFFIPFQIFIFVQFMIYNLQFILQHIKHQSTITQNSYKNNKIILPQSQIKTLTQYFKHGNQLHISIWHFVHGIFGLDKIIAGNAVIQPENSNLNIYMYLSLCQF